MNVMQPNTVFPEDKIVTAASKEDKTNQIKRSVLILSSHLKQSINVIIKFEIRLTFVQLF